ncbi:hypothetical protein GCM10027051_18800 [Niabella terrae]
MLTLQASRIIVTEKIHTTHGIVLRTVKYGETSIIVSVYTELFGLQSYLVNGIRKASRKGSSKAVFFQPAALLDMEVYHNELRQLHRIKEYRFTRPYQRVFTDVLKNGAACYMIELLTKCLKQPDSNPGLFAFVEDCLLHLDAASGKILANMPLFFAVQLCRFFGFMPAGRSIALKEDGALVFDAQEGQFTEGPVFHNELLRGPSAALLAELLLVQQPEELATIETNVAIRREVLEIMETYYNHHLQDFGKLKTLPVLRALMR